MPESADISDRRGEARAAWGFGLAAMGLCVVAPCSSGMSLVIALPLGAVASVRGRRLLAAGPDAVTEAYARTARITGDFALIWSVLVAVSGGVFLLLYGSLIAALFVVDF